MKYRFGTIFFAVTLLVAQNAYAAKTKTVTSAETVTPVVELFTSEGCSSCPPADQWLSKLGETVDEQFRAVPLAFHVDYWNYLGWTDPYSSEQYTDWQRKVAKNNRQRSMYTPEFTVAGMESRGAHEILDNIRKANNKPADVFVTMRMMPDGVDKLNLEVAVDNQHHDLGVQIFVALYENNIVRKIGAGENTGRTLEHDHVVRFWSHPKSLLNGSQTETYTLFLPQDAVAENVGVATVIIDSKTGKTLQSLSAGVAELFADS
ncbi:MAG: DUF1223 domain-containing protein [Pseudomonadota bacterium]